jgi:hypothetical protein
VKWEKRQWEQREAQRLRARGVQTARGVTTGNRRARREAAGLPTPGGMDNGVTVLHNGITINMDIDMSAMPRPRPMLHHEVSALVDYVNERAPFLGCPRAVRERGEVLMSVFADYGCTALVKVGETAFEADQLKWVPEGTRVSYPVWEKP